MVYTLIHPRCDLERSRSATRLIGVPDVREVLPNSVDARTRRVRRRRVGTAAFLRAQLRVLLGPLKHSSHLGTCEEDPQQVIQSPRLNLRVGQPARERGLSNTQA